MTLTTAPRALSAADLSRPTVSTPTTGPRSGGRARLSTADIARRARASVVTIVTPTKQGSGVVVDPGGLVVTNLHVVRGASTLTVKFENGDTYSEAEVVDVDERKDLVVLKLKAFGLSAAALGNSDRVQAGDRVVLVGSPKGLELTVSDGIVSAVRDSGEGYRLLQTSAAASPGSSGGGMFNDAGELIGIVSAKMSEGENLNFALPINYARGLLGSTDRTTLNELAVRYPGNDAGTTAAAVATEVPVDAGLVRLKKLIESSGLNTKTADDKMWVVAYSGEHLETVAVYISLYDDYALAQSEVSNDKPTLDQAIRVLKLNYALDLARIAIDDDGVVTALQQADLHDLTGPALKQMVEEVARAADQCAELLAKMSSPPAPDLTMSRAGGLTAVPLLQGHALFQYDAREWRLDPTASSAGVLQFVHRNNEIFFKIIAERLPIDLEKIAQIGLVNIRKVDPQAAVTRRGSRRVNGLPMVLREFDVTTEGLQLVFYGHYYSDAAGTVQLIGWTGKNLIDEHRAIIESFVSGFQLAP